MRLSAAVLESKLELPDDLNISGSPSALLSNTEFMGLSERLRKESALCAKASSELNTSPNLILNTLVQSVTDEALTY